MAEYTSGLIKTTTPNVAFTGDVSVDNIRRSFGISDQVHQLAPAESIFFSYLSKLGKKSIDETVWKPLEYRNQWQRRNFSYQGAKLTGGDGAAVTNKIAVTDNGTLTHILVWCDYDLHGKQTKSAIDPLTDAYIGYAPIFLTKNQVFRLNGVAYKFLQSAAGDGYDVQTWTAALTSTAAGKKGGLSTYISIPIANLVKVSDQDPIVATDAVYDTNSTIYKGQVIGSQWGEATGAPDGFRDDLTNVEFFSQIFKTSVPLMSGSTMATKYRGFTNEWKRIYAEHLKSHKMDLEQAFLFGYGKYVNQDTRMSWGAIPFIENKGGKQYQLGYSGNAHASAPAGRVYDKQLGFTYDGMTELMDDFMSYESGNSGQKLCLTSRKVINHLHKMGNGGFLAKSLGASNPLSTVFSSNLEVKKSSFMPIDITSISTSWGSMNFIAHPLMRGDMEDKAVCIDLSNVSLRPLAGNGISRDTFVETNVQENDIDGRKDMIITEAGLEVLMPETHATIDFAAGA